MEERKNKLNNDKLEEIGLSDLIKNSNDYYNEFMDANDSVWELIERYLGRDKNTTTSTR